MSTQPTPVSADALGILQLCMDNQPEGMAVLSQGERGNSSGDVLAIFKAHQVWLLRLDTFIESILKHQDSLREPMITTSNGLDARQIFQNYPTGTKLVVAFSGLDSTHPMYENLLIFKDNQLFRHKIDKVSLTDSSFKNGNMFATLLGQHKTDHWHSWPTSFWDIQAIYTLRATRLLTVRTRVSSTTVTKTIYALNAKSFDFPVDHQLRPLESSGDSGAQLYEGKMLLHNRVMLAGKELNLSYLRDSGKVCVDEKCVNFREFILCDSAVDIYTQGFAYWLHHDTDMSLRLLIVALISVMLVNSAMSIMFMWNQLNKVFSLA